jgi:multiple sugar transport system substrate-binding protein
MVVGKADQGSGAMRVRAILLTAALALVPLNVQAADLVVWWEEGFYPEEDQAARELVQAFEAETGRNVELVFQPYLEGPSKAEAALAVSRPPDIMLGDESSIRGERWAAAGALADLFDVLLPIRDRFLPGQLEFGALPDSRTGRPSDFTVPLARASLYVHVWTSLLEQAGFALADIPTEWEPFWAFWCDKVQPAVRRALGREDVWGLGLAMSAASTDMVDAVTQFMIAHQAYFWPAGGRRQLDDPSFRPNLIKALEEYTAPWRKGCIPPDAVHWKSPDNNKAL